MTGAAYVHLALLTSDPTRTDYRLDGAACPITTADGRLAAGVPTAEDSAS